MNAQYFRRLFDYNYWAHRRVWSCVVQLSEEQFSQPSDYSVGSVHEQLVHTMEAEWLWLTRVLGNSVPRLAPASEYPTRHAIRARWDFIETEWRAYVSVLKDDDLSKLVEFESISDHTQRRMILWEALAHLLNHGTDHRAQTLARIHQVGGKTIEQDIAFYAWE